MRFASPGPHTAEHSPGSDTRHLWTNTSGLNIKTQLFPGANNVSDETEAAGQEVIWF